MARNKAISEAATRSMSLRERAEELLQTKSLDVPTMPTGDVQALVHELSVHQVELEIQNEDLRQAQVELAQSRDRYSDLYEYAPVGYLTLNKDGQILEANLTTAMLLGVERQSLIHAPFTKFLARSSQDDFYRHRQALAANETKQVCELEMRTSHGGPLVLRLESIAFDLTKDGQSRTALIDITAMKQAQSALISSEERLRSVLETATDAIVTINESGLVQSFNRAAEQMFGYDVDEVIGRNVRMLMPSPYHEEHDGYLKRYQETRIKRIIGIGRELTGKRKDGSIFPLGLSISAVDHLNLYMGLLRDLSTRKHLEQQVVEIASLEQQRIGQDLHDSVGQQLSGMILMAQLMLESARQAEPEEVDLSPIDRLKLLQRLSTQAERLRSGLEDALQDIRTICRELTPVPINEDGLVVALEQLVANASQQSLLNWTFHCPIPINALDNITATHLFNIAQGAISNVLRHAQARSIQISLKQSDSQLVLSVRDDGTGLPPSGMSGLGMRIMQNRAQIIGGILAIRTVQPTGTEVTCTMLRHQHRSGIPAEMDRRF